MVGLDPRTFDRLITRGSGPTKPISSQLCPAPDGSSEPPHLLNSTIARFLTAPLSVTSSPLRVSRTITSFLEPVIDKVRPSKEYYIPYISHTQDCFFNYSLNWTVQDSTVSHRTLVYMEVLAISSTCLKGTADHSKSGCLEVFSTIRVVAHCTKTGRTVGQSKG